VLSVPLRETISCFFFLFHARSPSTLLRVTRARRERRGRITEKIDMISMIIASKAPHKAVPITIYRNQCGELDEKNKSAYSTHQALHMEPLSDPVYPVYPVKPSFLGVVVDLQGKQGSHGYGNKVSPTDDYRLILQGSAS
jgi:hypothetical protein